MDVPTWLRQEGGDSSAERESDSCTDSFLKKGRTVQLGGNLEVPDDGFSWLKYGQKHIRGTQNRRNYYRCSQHREVGCPAKKTIDFRPNDPSELCIAQAEPHNHPPRWTTTPHPHPASKHLFFQTLNKPQNTAAAAAAAAGNAGNNIARTVAGAAARGQGQQVKRNFPSVGGGGGGGGGGSVSRSSQQAQLLPQKRQSNDNGNGSSDSFLSETAAGTNFVSTVRETNKEIAEYSSLRENSETDSPPTKQRKTDVFFGANSPSAASSGITTDAPESVHPYRTTSTGSTLGSKRGEGMASPGVLENSSSQANNPKCTDFQIPMSTDKFPPAFGKPDTDILPSLDQSCLTRVREGEGEIGRGRGGKGEGEGGGGEGGGGGGGGGDGREITQCTEIHVGRLGCTSATSDLDCILGPATCQWMAQGEQNANWSCEQEISHFSEEASSSSLWDSFLAEIIRGEDSTNEVSPLGLWEPTTGGHVAGGHVTGGQMGGGHVAGEGEGEGEELPYLIQSMESGVSEIGVCQNGVSESGICGIGVFGNGVSENGIFGNMFFGNGLLGNVVSGNGFSGNDIYCGSVPPDGALLEVPLPPYGDMGAQLLTPAAAATWQAADVAQSAPMLLQQLLTSSLPGGRHGRTEATWRRCLGV